MPGVSPTIYRVVAHGNCDDRENSIGDLDVTSYGEYTSPQGGHYLYVNMQQNSVYARQRAPHNRNHLYMVVYFRYPNGTEDTKTVDITAYAEFDSQDPPAEATVSMSDYTSPPSIRYEW